MRVTTSAKWADVGTFALKNDDHDDLNDKNVTSSDEHSKMDLTNSKSLRLVAYLES